MIAWVRITTVAILLATLGCSDSSQQRVRVFAAASLTQSFEELAAAFESEHPGVEVELHCAGTPRLVLQLREGADADVFASADDFQMRRVVDAGQTSATPVGFAGNELTIITSGGNPHEIHSLADLQKPEIGVLMCGPEVPAGRYAREALKKAGVNVQSRSDEPSVRAVVSKIRLGVADAGIVYATDAQAAAGQDGVFGTKIHRVAIPEHHNVRTQYPIAPLVTGEHGALGTAFVAFVTGPAGQAILASHGFTKP
jgi:molybdate transport system substrate-binding protein